MKKLLTIVLIVLSIVLIVSGCSSEQAQTASEESVLKVGATPVPHAELLEFIKPQLQEQGVRLEIIEFTDYVKPNLALNDKEIDANFFQHLPYLQNFNAEHHTMIESAGLVHVEPLGLYSNRYDSINDFKNGSVIAIPADSVNGGRALQLLENNGLITLEKDAGLEATEEAIVENPNQFTFKAIEAAQLPRVLPDVDGAIINGNYALESDLNPLEDSLLLEGKASPYANVLAIHADDQGDETIKLLVETLQTKEVKDFIKEHYEGGVVPAF